MTAIDHMSHFSLYVLLAIISGAETNFTNKHENVSQQNTHNILQHNHTNSSLYNEDTVAHTHVGWCSTVVVHHVVISHAIFLYGQTKVCYLQQRNNIVVSYTTEY
jgi:hypothetical protein